MPRTTALRALLLAALVALLVPRAAAAAAPAASVAEADRISAAALAALVPRQQADGRFADPTGRTVGGAGLPTVAFAALAAAGPGGEDRLKLARRTLGRGDGATIVLRWPLAMAAAEELADLPAEDRAKLRRTITSWSRLRAAGKADRCYVSPSCFNNYKLVDQLLNLELARTGVRSEVEGARLNDPAKLRTSALRWLGTQLPRHAPATATVTIPGAGRRRAALLTDPGALPMAYHAMCTAWAVRAVRLAGPAAPQPLRKVARDALWALVGLAAPDGGVSWSGRGQDQAWTLSAALYAAAAGARAFADSDPDLAARLRRLADIELQALAGRLTPQGLQVLPAGNGQLQGLDGYYSGVGSTGLALTFLAMARDELPDRAFRRAPIPAEVDGGTFTDATRSGLVARRSGAGWLGVRMRRDHAYDPRQDSGVARALRLVGGTWLEDRIARPVRTAGPAPIAGPALVRGGRPLPMRATGVRPIAGGVELTGEFRGRSGAGVPARWRITSSAHGVTWRVACGLGRRLALTEYLPRAGELQRGQRFLARAGFQVTLPAAFTARPLATRFANARQPSLVAYRLGTTCRAGWTTFRLKGTARAAA